MISTGCKLGVELIKHAFINEAKIIYNYESNGSPGVLLKGMIGDEQMTFGNMYSIKLDTEQTMFQAHFSVDEAYLGLGYGREMMAVMTKLAQINDGYIVNISWDGSVTTDMNLKFMKSIINDSGFEIIPICIIRLGDMNTPIVFKIKDLEMIISQINEQTNNGLDNEKIKKLKDTIKKITLSKQVFNFKGMTYSVGYMIKNIGAKASFPVQLESDEDRNAPENRWEERKRIYGIKEQRATNVLHTRNPGLKEQEEKAAYQDMMDDLDNRPINFLYSYGEGREPFINYGHLVYSALDACCEDARIDSLTLSSLVWISNHIAKYPLLQEYKARIDNGIREAEKEKEEA